LALSFALDYDRQGGNPSRPQTRIGNLRSRAKPYSVQPTKDTFIAANKLAQLCLEFLAKVNCYRFCDCVVAMPPSDPKKQFDLPSFLASEIAKGLDKPDLSKSVDTVRLRPALKNVPLGQKLDALEGTIKVDRKIFKGKQVLLIDDLYQSGVSMNYAAMLILEAGAKAIYGLACEKTCRNDDNIKGGR
jgi:predicted amidophosphoribosyltransferase